MTKMKKLSVAAIFTVASILVAAGSPAQATECIAEESTMLDVSAAGRPIEVYGRDVGHAAIQELWGIVSVRGAHAFLGRIIAAGQNWFEQCKYPGIGIAAGSGYNLDTRNVWIWVWADEVDLVQARASVVEFLGAAVEATVPTTTTTTTTTTAPVEEEIVVPAEEPTTTYAVATMPVLSTTSPSVPSTSGPAVLSISAGALQSSSTTSVKVKKKKKKKKKTKKTNKVKKANIYL